MTMVMNRPRRVYVDGVDQGEVFRRRGRWMWHRGPLSVESFRRSQNLHDVAEWARKCCNGQKAVVKTVRG
jgi:hypothetical protein